MLELANGASPVGRGFHLEDDEGILTCHTPAVTDGFLWGVEEIRAPKYDLPVLRLLVV